MSISLIVTNERRVPRLPKVGPTVQFDPDEGRWVKVTCLACRNGLAVLEVARPFVMFHLSIDCCECGTELVRFDSLNDSLVTKEDF